MVREYSKYQKAIFSFVQGDARYSEDDRAINWDEPIPEPYVVDFMGARNAVVEAVAGSGKTTTIVEALNFTVRKAEEPDDDFMIMCGNKSTYRMAPRQPKVLFVAFNKHIAEELQRRVPSHVQASTLNSVGWGICRDSVRGVRLDVKKDENILRTFYSTDFEEQRKIYYRIKGPVTRMVSLLKSLAITNYEDVFNRFDEIADKYCVEFPEIKEVDFKHLTHQVWEKSVNTKSHMNFDDQIFMPIFNDWTIPSFNWVFGDEAQDWSPVQIELVKRLGQNGQVVAVGDRRQSIYGWRGSDPDAIPNIITALEAVVLPLSICYRCPDKVIAKAREIVPHIESPPENPKGEGTVEWVSTPEFIKMVNNGDFVLCRTTAPLIKRCLELIRDGRKAVVKGRDIGRGLIDLLASLAPSPQTPVGNFLETLMQYKAEQLEKYNKAGREAEAMAVEDRCDTLEALAMGCDRTINIQQRIDAIFSDEDSDGITFCTGHRSKGLEANRIFMLRPDLCPHPKASKPWQVIQEDNLRYVMYTRAMSELYFVQKERGEK